MLWKGNRKGGLEEGSKGGKEDAEGTRHRARISTQKKKHWKLDQGIGDGINEITGRWINKKDQKRSRIRKKRTKRRELRFSQD